MTRNQYVSLEDHEISQLFDYRLALAKEASGPEFHAHIARAKELAEMLPDTPLETQIKLYEAAA